MHLLIEKINIILVIKICDCLSPSTFSLTLLSYSSKIVGV